MLPSMPDMRSWQQDEEDVPEDGWRSGECIRCNRCMENCPKQNIRTEVPVWKGSEWWSLILKATLVMGMILL